MSKQITVYTFEELSKEAQQAAVYNNRYVNVEYCEWWDRVFDLWKEKLAVFGYDDVEIQFSGFSSQGDGASFTAGIHLRKWIKSMGLYTELRSLYYWLGGKLLGDTGYASVDRTSHRYCHENTISGNTEFYQLGRDLMDYTEDSELVQRAETQLAKLEKTITEHARDLCRKIYADLEKNHDVLISDNEVKDLLIQGEAYFFEDGTNYE